MVTGTLSPVLEGHTLFTCSIPSKGFVNWGSLSSYCRTQNWLAVAIRREKKILANPPDNTVLRADDEMIVIASSRPKI
ncbi:MAG: TrkA C-terminal domain-containing protein [Patescibacteria group bacterium]